MAGRDEISFRINHESLPLTGIGDPESIGQGLMAMSESGLIQLVKTSELNFTGAWVGVM
jgi:hypothetical protein